MSLSRRCSRTACGGSAIATLTYVYADQTAVLGPLATYAEPHTYDLCAEHAERLTAPRGWDVVRLASEFADPGRRPTTWSRWPTPSARPGAPGRDSSRRPAATASPARSRPAVEGTSGAVVRAAADTCTSARLLTH